MPRGLAPANICPSGSIRAPTDRPSDQSSPLLDRVAARRQLAQHRVVETTLHHQLARPRRARPEAARPVLGMKSRRVDRLLDGHAVMHHAQEKDQRPLVLLLAARRAERHPRLAVAQRETGRQRGARPLAGRQAVGNPSRSQNICPRVPMQNPSSGITGDDCSQPPEGVALTMLPCAIDHVDMAGVGADHAEPRHGRLAGAGAPAPARRAARRRDPPPGVCPSTAPGRRSIDARSPTSARRSAL